MKPSRSSALEGTVSRGWMGLAILLGLEGLWASLWLWAGVTVGHHWLVILAMLLWGSSMIAGAFMIFHGIYLMYRLLPAIDEHLDPHLAAYTRQRGDPMFWRIHRVLLYSGSLAWRWAHRRMEYRDYDFRSLPLYLRLPLLVEFYTFVATGFAFAMAAALMEISKGVGLM